MRHVATHMHYRSGFALPRGWVILGAALASWAMVAVAWAGMTQVYGFIVAAL